MKYIIQINFIYLCFNMVTRNFKIKHVSYIIFLLDRATLELVFLLSAFFMRFKHGGGSSRIHGCLLLYSSTLLLVDSWICFTFFPSYKQWCLNGQKFLLGTARSWGLQLFILLGKQFFSQLVVPLLLLLAA